MASTSYVVPPTISTGGAANSADQNKLRDGILSAFGNKAELRLRRAANQSINNNSLTAISWDTEDTDTDGFIAVTSSTITIPTGFGGIYVMSVMLEDGNATAARKFTQVVAGGNTWVAAHYGEVGSTLTVTTRLAAAATIVVSRYQNSGGALNTTGRLEMNRIGI